MHDYLKGRSYPIMSMFFFLSNNSFFKTENGKTTLLLHVVYSTKTKIRSRV